MRSASSTNCSGCLHSGGGHKGETHPLKVNATEPSIGRSSTLNNVVEADHSKLKQLIRPVRGFKTLKTAYATIKGFEVMRALRKGQAGAFNITRDICGEARIVERAFGLGASALSEAVRLITTRLDHQAA